MSLTKLTKRNGTPDGGLPNTPLLNSRPDGSQVIADDTPTSDESGAARADAPQMPLSRPPVKGHGTKYGRKKEAAIAALLTQKNHAEAARATGIDLKTLKRWLRLPEFIEEYRRARWEVVEQAYARVQQNTGAAASILLKLMVDPVTPASGRIRAALGIFGLAREALDLDIETRVAELERAAELAKSSLRGSTVYLTEDDMKL
jgi:hypothetical protein